MKVAINKIKPDPNQPRKTFEGIDELAKTIKKEGLLYPILLDQDNQIIDGERRYLAIKKLGWDEVEINRWQIKDKDHRLLLQLISDIQHKELPILERDKAWLQLWKMRNEPSYKSLEEALGYGREHISDAIERATYVAERGSNPDWIPADISKTTFLKKKPEIRAKVIEKLGTIRGGAEIKEQTLKRIRRAKDDSEINKIIEEDYTDYSREVDRILSAIDVILKTLRPTLMLQIPPTQAVILSSAIVDLKNHLKTWDAEEGEVA